jgi:hypothetical protein
MRAGEWPFGGMMVTLSAAPATYAALNIMS